MRIISLRSAAIVLAAGIGLGGCATYSPYGYGNGLSVSLGSGYGGYGGYGSYGGYYDPFYDPYYMGYRSGYGSRFGGYYGSPYGGWYNGFYYPGFGYYVYDRQNRRQVWSDFMRDFWISRGATLQASGVNNTAVTADGTVRRPIVTRDRQVRTQVTRDRPARTRVVAVERSTRSAAAEPTRSTRTERRSAASSRSDERAAERAARRAERAERTDRDD